MKGFRRRRRRIVAALSDIHSGNRVGLLSPDVVLIRENDNGDIEEWTPEPTTTQVELWKAYLDNIVQLREFAGRDEIVVLHCGDATQGDRYNATIPDVTREDQRQIAVANLMPLVSLPNVRKARLVTGTPVHVPEAAEARIAYQLGKDTGKDVRNHHHTRLDVDGVTFDVAHHGPFPGSRDWLKGNVARFHLRDRIQLDRRNGVEPATVYLYGHYHEWVFEMLTETWQGETRTHYLVILPSYSGLTSYARKVTRSVPFLTTGMGAFEIVDGVLMPPKPFKQTWDLRSEEEL